jgi:hypothetical protein
MKRILTILFLTMLVPTAFANPSPQVEEQIQSIRQHYGQINAGVPRYKRVKKNLTGFSAEGGELIAYFHGPTIMKMVATYYGETGRTAEEFYYWDGKLIFVLRREHRYSKPLSGKIVSTKEDRFYFSNDKLIRWIDENAKEVAADKTEYQEEQKEFLENSKLLTDGARSKNPIIESNQ